MCRNTKKLRAKTLLALMLTLVCILGSSLTVFAYGTVQEVADKYGPGGSAGYSGWPSSLAGYFTTSGDATHNLQVNVNGKAYFYPDTYTDSIIAAADTLDKKEAAKIADQQAVTQFSEVTSGFEIAADVQTAGNMMSGFMGVLRTLLGVMVVVASVGMTVFSGFDICYIAFPVFRNKCEEAKQTGTGPMASGKKTASGENKLRFVSDDAQYAVVAADTVQSGKNPFVIYFGKRLLSYIVLSILLFILLTGRITVFTDLALKLVSGILDIIQSV